jgi:transposase
MKNTRRKYSAEFKQEAVALVQQSNQSITQIASSLGINDNMLRRWIKELSEPAKTAFPGNGTPRDEEVARLKRELAEVKRERDFLREAATYFAKNPK